MAVAVLLLFITAAGPFTSAMAIALGLINLRRAHYDAILHDRYGAMIRTRHSCPCLGIRVPGSRLDYYGTQTRLPVVGMSSTFVDSCAGQVPTISYTECSFPFTYGGVVRYSCIKNMTGVTDINNQYGCNAVSTPNQVNATGAICTGQPEGYQCPVGPSTLSVGSNSYQTTDVCGWSVVMLRYNTTTFNWTQNWNAYKNGFGSPDGSDFWLGLEPLYQLTSTGNYRLRIEVSKRDLGILAWYSGEYYQFNIGDELTSQYAISVSGWTGDGVALDSFNPPKSLANATQNGQKFSTFDVDNDNYPGPYFNGSCSQWYGGVGWWFSNSSSYCFYQLLTNMNLGANYWGYNYKGLSYYRASSYGVRWMIKPR